MKSLRLDIFNRISKGVNLKNKYKYKIEFRGRDDSLLSVNNDNEHLRFEIIVSAKDEAEARNFLAIVIGNIHKKVIKYEILEFSKMKKYTYKKRRS